MIRVHRCCLYHARYRLLRLETARCTALTKYLLAMVVIRDAFRQPRVSRHIDFASPLVFTLVLLLWNDRHWLH